MPTPDDCLQQVANLQRLTGVEHLVTESGFGGMPHEQAELSMRLFAEHVVLVSRRDPALTTTATPARTERRPAGRPPECSPPA